MTLQTLDSKDLIESITTGVVPVPAGIAEDNAKQAAKREKEPEKPKATVIDSDAPPKVESAESEGDDTEGEDGLTPRQKREFTKSMLATVGKKHRKMMEAEEFAADQYRERTMAERRATELEAENTRLKAAIEPPKPAEVKSPDRKDFTDDISYQSALIDFRVEQKLQERAAADRKIAEEQRQAQIRETAGQRIAHAIELVPDFVEVTESVDWPTPPAVAGYMQESEMFAEIGYYLAQHEEVRAKLDKLSPAKQLVEIGKIESTLQPFAHLAKENASTASHGNGTKPSTETVPEPSKPRVIAPVIRPLSGGGAAQVEKAESEKTVAEVRRDFERKHGVKFLARKRH